METRLIAGNFITTITGGCGQIGIIDTLLTTTGTGINILLESLYLANQE